MTNLSTDAYMAALPTGLVAELARPRPADDPFLITPLLAALPWIDDPLDHLDHDLAQLLIAGYHVRGLPIYAVDCDAVTAAANSSPPDDADVPLLPHPIIVVETTTCGTWELAGKDGNARIEFLVIAREIERGVINLTEDDGRDPWVIRALLDLGIDRRGERFTMIETRDPDTAFMRVAREAVYLIENRDVEHAPIDRHLRRRTERATGQSFPTQATRIKIGQRSSGGTRSGSGRTYSCRWQVRGHWRTFSDGRRVRVRSYFKGPAGAPWRTPFHPVRIVPPRFGSPSREGQDG